MKIRDILRDDGLLFIGLPGIMNIHLAYHSDLLQYLQIAHVYHFSLTTLDNLLGKYGFERVFGNEIIWSVYKKCEKGHVLVNDYDSAKVYLKKIKKFRYFYCLYSGLGRVGNIFLGYLAGLLKCSMFDDAARRVYKKLKFGK